MPHPFGWLRNLVPDAAELCIEVLSPGAESEHRDRVVKRKDYREAGVANY